MHIYIHTFIYIYIHIHLYMIFKGEHGPGALWVASFLHGAVPPLLKPWVAPDSALVGTQGPKGGHKG